MELEHNEGPVETDFNLPEEVFELMRIQISQHQKKEFGARSLICWEDIMTVKEYGFDDDWLTYPGSKYYILLHGRLDEMLVLGDYEIMRDKFIEFRTKWPIFRDF